MGSRAVVRPLNQENRGEINQKQVMENVRTRKVLGDIGNNIATQRAVQTGKNPKAEVAGGNSVLTRAATASKKTTIQTLPKPETVIVISPDKNPKAEVAGGNGVLTRAAAASKKTTIQTLPKPETVIVISPDKNPKAEVAGGNGVLTRAAAASKKTTIQTLPKPETVIVISPDKNPKAEVAGGNGVLTRAAAASKKTTIQTLPKPETVIVISSDKKNTSKKTLTKTPKRKGSKTFSGTLTARSKAASGLKNETKEKVIDIDELDSNNELAAVDYVDDIYKFYKIAEDEITIADYMNSQPEINSKMRSILIDWLIEVHRKFELMPETLFLAVNIIDRFLSNANVARKKLQLVGISSMLIACKYEEVWAPEVDDFVSVSDDAYAAEDVLVMEKAILERLKWYLTVPTPYVFLVRFVKASVPLDNEMENMAFFLAELGLVQYQVAVAFRPSLVAASAVYAARQTLKRTPFWTETLKHHTGYSKDRLLECAKMLGKFHASAGESKLRAAYKKYSVEDNGGVALLLPAKNLLVPSSPTEKKRSNFE